MQHSNASSTNAAAKAEATTSPQQNNQRRRNRAAVTESHLAAAYSCALFVWSRASAILLFVVALVKQ